MKSIVEIEQAILQLPPQERLEVARWLLEDLQESTVIQAESNTHSNGGAQTPPLPDYAGRRRRIFGGKVLPNMVLAARADEPW